MKVFYVSADIYVSARDLLVHQGLQDHLDLQEQTQAMASSQASLSHPVPLAGMDLLGSLESRSVRWTKAPFFLKRPSATGTILHHCLLFVLCLFCDGRDRSSATSLKKTLKQLCVKMRHKSSCCAVFFPVGVCVSPESLLSLLLSLCFRCLRTGLVPLSLMRQGWAQCRHLNSALISALAWAMAPVSVLGLTLTLPGGRARYYNLVCWGVKIQQTVKGRIAARCSCALGQRGIESFNLSFCFHPSDSKAQATMLSYWRRRDASLHFSASWCHCFPCCQRCAGLSLLLRLKL